MISINVSRGVRRGGRPTVSDYFGGFSGGRCFTGTSSSDVISYSGFGTPISQ
jgi:hypothetical protein